mgnify:CR=1 FL=1
MSYVKCEEFFIIATPLFVATTFYPARHERSEHKRDGIAGILLKGTVGVHYTPTGSTTKTPPVYALTRTVVVKGGCHVCGETP